MRIEKIASLRRKYIKFVQSGRYKTDMPPDTQWHHRIRRCWTKERERNWSIRCNSPANIVARHLLTMLLVCPDGIAPPVSTSGLDHKPCSKWFIIFCSLLQETARILCCIEREVARAFRKVLNEARIEDETDLEQMPRYPYLETDAFPWNMRK